MARTGVLVSKLDRIKAELGLMTFPERRGVADYIRYLNTLASKRQDQSQGQVPSTAAVVAEHRTSTRKPRKGQGTVGARRGRKPRTATIPASEVSTVSIAPSDAIHDIETDDLD